MTTESRPLLDELAAALRVVLADYRKHDCGTMAARSAAADALARYDAERSRFPEAPEAVRGC